MFIPWYVDPTYVEEVPKNFKRTPEEREMVKKYKLTNGQLMFRRRKVAQNGLDLWNQEYPAEPEMAFLTTGRPVFNPEQLQQCLKDANDVEDRLALEGDEFLPNIRGELTIYRKHDAGEMGYVVGADVAMVSVMEIGQSHRCSTPRNGKSPHGEDRFTPITLQRYSKPSVSSTTKRLS